MNKPVNQHELVPAAAAPPPAEEIVGRLIAAQERIIAAAGPDPDNFDWSSDDSVVVKPRPGIAMYENKFGDVVIRTQNTTGDDDHFAYITPEALPAVIKALKEHLP